MTSGELFREFPPGKTVDNTSFTDIHGVQFNLTTLHNWKYTYWANDTISNTSWCQLVNPKFMTATNLLANGTWVNGTSCYTPVWPIGLRSAVGIGFAVVYGLCLVFIFMNLKRHGELHIHPDKRFYPIGRRWQWYWAIFICAMALIGLFFGLDIDRYYVMDLPIVITVFAWFLMQMGTTALVWEAVRHWGSWMERQFIDPNPFVLHEKDRRGMFEFWLPLWFYMWLWLNFFMIIPRNWTGIIKQRNEEQILTKAIPTATETRFKAAGFMLVICWITIMVSLWHSIRHYEPRNRGTFNRILGFLGYMPFRFVLEIPLLLALVAYQILVSFDWTLSPLNAKGNLIAIFVGGYLPTLLIVIIQIIDGFIRPNEDKELLRQRRQRGEAVDRDLGITKKPAWWRRVKGDLPAENMADMVTRNVREVGGRQPTRNVADRRSDAADAQLRPQRQSTGAQGTTIEMNNMSPRQASATGGNDDVPPPYEPYRGKSDARRNDQFMQTAASMLFPNAPPPPGPGQPQQQQQSAPAPPRPGGPAERTPSTTSGLSTSGPPQQVKSMLDV